MEKHVVETSSYSKSNTICFKHFIINRTVSLLKQEAKYLEMAGLEEASLELRRLALSLEIQHNLCSKQHCLF